MKTIEISYKIDYNKKELQFFINNAPVFECSLLETDKNYLYISISLQLVKNLSQLFNVNELTICKVFNQIKIDSKYFNFYNNKFKFNDYKDIIFIFNLFYKWLKQGLSKLINLNKIYFSINKNFNC